MRVALIADIHGNEQALEAVLADIERAGVDATVCLGDVATLGPRPNESIALVEQLGCRCVMGNHDAFLLEPALIQAYTDTPVIREAVDWCRERVSPAHLEFLGTFEPVVELEVGAGVTLLACHGTPGSNVEDMLATTPPEALDQMLEGVESEVVASGHTHIQMLRQHRGTLIVNPGSVGMPFVEYVGGRTPELLPHAEYAILEARSGLVGVTQHRVAFDLTTYRQVLRESDFPLKDWLIAQYPH